ncbi:hypothetical protein RDABS01_026953 [Bienertia sinuspersici]
MIPVKLTLSDYFQSMVELNALYEIW